MIIDPHCPICRNEKRVYIDIAVSTQGQRATAKQFGVSRQSIQRHIDKGHCSEPIEIPPGAKLEPVKVAPREIPDNPPLVDETLAYEGIGDAKPDAPQEKAPKRRKPAKLPPPRRIVDRRTVTEHERTLATITDYPSRKAYVGKMLRTGTFNGMPTIERLKGCWPDLTYLQLAEITAQAAMEADFLRGTRQARRLVVIAKADKIYRDAMSEKDYRTALRALEFYVRVDGVSAEPDLIASLAASQAWTVAAKVLQERFPDAFDAIHGALVAEEARKRQALVPATLGDDQRQE